MAYADWMRQFLGEGAGQFSYGPTGELMFGGRGKHDLDYESLNGEPIQYNDDGYPILTQNTDNGSQPVASATPYWDYQGLMGAVAQQGGGQVAAPLQSLLTEYQRSDLPRSGVSFQQFINATYPGAQVQDVPGIGQVLIGAQYTPQDWSPQTGAGQGGLGAALREALPVALKMYGIGTGLGGLGGTLGLGEGMAGMAEGYGALEASMGGLEAGSSGLEALAGGGAGGFEFGDFSGLEGMAEGYEALENSLGRSIGDVGVPDYLGMEGMAQGYGALEDSMGRSIGAPGNPSPNVPGIGRIAGAINSALGTNLNDSDLSLFAKLAATGLGAYGSSKGANSAQGLYNNFLDMGAPYRSSLAALEANPAAYYQSPEVQGALQQGSDTLARSLSTRVGNPILNPTALQELQNYTTNGLLGQLNQRRNFLANAGQLGLGQAGAFGQQAANASGNVYNALGAGLNTVFGQQRDYAGDLLEILKQGKLSGSNLVSPQ